MNIELRIILLLSIVVSLCHCSDYEKMIISVKPIVIEVNSIEKFGTYSKIVALETPQNVLLGGIDKVSIDTRNGDILVSDKRVTHTVVRFDSNGRFILKYGNRGNGPGEYTSLSTYLLRSNGQVIVFSLGKRILFDPDGSLLSERFAGRNDLFAIEVENRLYVYSFKGTNREPYMISILDEKLNVLKQFHTYDPHMEKLPYAPFNGLTNIGSKLIVNHLSDFGFSIYDLDGKPLNHFRFPNENYKLAYLWRKSRAELLKRPQKLVQSLHRAKTIHGFGNFLYLHEINQSLGIDRSILWDSATGEACAFEGVNLISFEQDTDYLSMDAIVGQYDGGVIGTCENPAKFASFQERYPLAKKINFDYSDNPVLLFFEFSALNKLVLRTSGEK